MSLITGRALHYVFKIGNRKASSHFFQDILGMKVLRHEEFAEGCEASCNGPFANRWSKTMVGYGMEDSHFVLELTYNYPIKSYDLGNDFIGITIRNSDVLKRASAKNYPIHDGNVLVAPDGYKFFIIDDLPKEDSDPVEKVTLASTDLQKSRDYWNTLLGCTIFEETNDSITLGFQKNDAKVELRLIDEPYNQGQSYGRMAFSCNFDQQPKIEAAVQAANARIVTPLISLDTPGKATVRVIILADPDGHEICFVDDENYRKLSQFDPDGETLLDRYIKLDKRDNM